MLQFQIECPTVGWEEPANMVFSPSPGRLGGIGKLLLWFMKNALPMTSHGCTCFKLLFSRQPLLVFKSPEKTKPEEVSKCPKKRTVYETKFNNTSKVWTGWTGPSGGKELPLLSVSSTPMKPTWRVMAEPWLTVLWPKEWHNIPACISSS